MTGQYKKAYIAFLLFFLLILFPGCERQEKPKKAISPQVEKQLVRIGVVPALTITETIKQYQPIVDYLNKRLNINAQLMPQKDFITVLDEDAKQ
ncbi:MAG: hypothetical protein M1147_07750 [Nitrospirae bacterium]|nr:hypothetical protein [Nitrospirota bacterium]MCL5978003.1 hypothetical protein [Nitrospirota bacterium]